MIKAVIFDMDGVVIDSERYWPESDAGYIASVIPDYDPKKPPSLRGVFGRNVYPQLKEFYRIDISADEFYERRTEWTLSHIYSRSKIITGVEECIMTLRNKGLLIALATSAPDKSINVVFQMYPQLKELFQVITSSTDVGGIEKPAPDIYLKTAEILGVVPESCLVIEDTDTGIQAAKSAGMTVYGFRNGITAHQTLSLADFVFNDFSEIKSSPHLDISSMR